jgi:hypothetical protein
MKEGTKYFAFAYDQRGVGAKYVDIATPAAAAVLAAVLQGKYIDTNPEGGHITCPPEVRSELDKLKVAVSSAEPLQLMHIRIPQQLKRDLEDKAKNLGLSLNSYCADLLAQYMYDDTTIVNLSAGPDSEIKTGKTNKEKK